MDLKQVLTILRKRIVIIVLIPLLSTISIAIISHYFIVPIYEAVSTLYIINIETNNEDLVTYDEILINQYLVKDYRELIKSKIITRTAIEELNISNLTPGKLSDRLTVSSRNDTRILEITVQDRNPERAAKLTNKICEVFISKSEEITNLSNIRVIDVAEVPSKPIKPNILLNIAFALLISIIVDLLLVYFLELLNEKIRTTEDIETYLGLNVLGTIPSLNIK